MSYFGGGIDSPHALLEVAYKKPADCTALNIFGFNRVVGTSFETLWNYGGQITIPTTEAQLSVVSSNAADTMQVLIEGVDANYNVVYDVITLSGVTPVTTTNYFMRVNNSVILSGSNAGNITISHSGNVIDFIDAGIGLNQACVYTVPAKHSLYIFRISLTSGTVNPNKYLTYRNRIDAANGRILRVAEATFQSNQQNFDRQIPFRIDEKNHFQFEAKSSSGENELSIFVEALLMRMKDE